MKKTGFYQTRLSLSLTLFFFVLSIQQSSSQTFCTKVGTEQFAGEKDGYRYELWNQNGQGNACMTLGDGALFSGEWSGILNYLARRGLSYNQTQTHQEIGKLFATYDCNYNASTASGNSYLSVYGWTVNPLKEYYIVEDWRNWIPSMAAGAKLKGTINVNDGIYDIYENTRVNQPSIIGNTTFQQYFSIRRNVRNNGTINISDHFDKWESLGMEMGKMYEASFVVEGYQSSGSFEFTALDVFVNNETDLVYEVPSESEYIRIYPNPALGKVSIKLDDTVLNASIRIYDTSGKIVFSQEDITNHLLQVSNLKSGMYFVNVKGSGFNYKTKFQVNATDSEK
ncbi:MAG: glycoside hydrolase family 11 protein [Prolixibacteraceae bacterium]